MVSYLLELPKTAQGQIPFQIQIHSYKSEPQIKISILKT